MHDYKATELDGNVGSFWYLLNKSNFLVEKREGADNIYKIVKVDSCKTFDLISLDERFDSFKNKTADELWESYFKDKIPYNLIGVKAQNILELGKYIFDLNRPADFIENRDFNKSEGVMFLAKAATIFDRPIEIGSLSILPTKEYSSYKVNIIDELGERRTYTSDIANMI